MSIYLKLLRDDVIRLETSIDELIPICEDMIEILPSRLTSSHREVLKQMKSSLRNKKLISTLVYEIEEVMTIDEEMHIGVNETRVEADEEDIIMEYQSLVERRLKNHDRIDRFIERIDTYLISKNRRRCI